MKYSLELGQDYIDHCLAVVASIDPEEVASRELGVLVGRNRSGLTSVYSLGSLITPNGLLHLAFKSTHGMPEVRVSEELKNVTLVTQRAPELTSSFPYFIGMLAINDDRGSVGILTEDATQGGNLPSFEMPVSEITQSILGRTFRDVGGISVFNQDALKARAAFNVGGEERILDFYRFVDGYRYGPRARDDYNHVFDKAFDAEAGLTVKIGSDSPLAKSLPF